MVMEQVGSANPGIAYAEPDIAVRRSGALEGDRPVLSYADFIETRRKRPMSIRRWAIVMFMPDTKGNVGEGPPALVPAEKAHKFYGQGYRYAVSMEELERIVEPPPPPPKYWVQSAVDDAMANGLPIPREMAPQGYRGPVLPDEELRVVDPDYRDPELEEIRSRIVYCNAGDPHCNRFFDSVDSMNGHKSRDHTKAKLEAAGIDDA